MKKVFTITLVSMLIALTGFANHLSGNLTMSAKLDGAQEVPAVVTNAIGVASFVLNATRDTFAFTQASKD
ncbi:MAG TPA: hypothetical protein VE978_17435 [Chitinophagales bacterium]|nr:hypothetical protein [Chitinophagales bacterium]